MHSAVMTVAILMSVGAHVIAQGTGTPQRRPPAPSAAAATRGMSNQDVIQLVKAGVGDDIVINQIRNADERRFDLSTAAIIALKAAGVSDRVLAFMQSPTTASGDGLVAYGVASDPSKPTSPRPVSQASPVSVGKPRIAVRVFENPTTGGGRSNLGNAVADIFVEELSKTGRFILLDTGNEPSADYVLGGKVANFEFHEDRAQADAANTRASGSERLFQKVASVRVEVRVTKRSTGEIFLADSGFATQTNTSAVSELADYDRYVRVGFATTEALNSMIGRTTIEAIRNAVRKVADRFPLTSAPSTNGSERLNQLLRQASRKLEDGYFSDAVSIYEEAQTLAPDSTQAVEKLLVAYLYNKQLDQADELAPQIFAKGGVIVLVALHNHALSWCEGELKISASGISYEPFKGKDRFAWQSSDIVTVGQDRIDMFGAGFKPSLVIRTRDNKGKEHRYDFVASAYFKTSPAAEFSPVREPQSSEAYNDTEKLHRILMRLITNR